MVIGSTWTRTGSSLRADRTRWTSPARGTARSLGARHPDDDPRLPVVDRDRAEHLGARWPVEQGEGVVDGTWLAGDGGQPAGRGQVGLGPALGLAAGEAGGVPRTSAWTAGLGGVADRDHRGTRRGQPDRADQRRRASSSVRRSGRASASQVSSRTTAA